MADISSQLNTIKQSERGESVREAINSALQAINNDVPPDIANPKQYTYDMEQGRDFSKTYDPPELISQIVVKQPGSGGKTTQRKSLKVTRNNTVWPRDEDPDKYDPDKDIFLYDKVEVEVETLANDVVDLDEPITQNGEYTAYGLKGADGIRSFVVNVSAASGEGPFNVEFYDKPASDPTAAVIQTQIVAKGSNVEFVGAPPTSSMGTFTGWTPSPNNVTRDMKCYPIFGQIIVDPTEILENWDVICQKRGVGYPLGAHKTLAYGATFTADEIRTINPSYAGNDVAFNVFMMMYKVAEGEGSSHSSWLSSCVSTMDMPNWLGEYSSGFYWAGNSRLRQFLNGIFFSHMTDIFKSNIIPVTKYSLDNSGVMVPTTDTIWIPGTSEVGTENTKPEGYETYDFINADYTANIARLDGVSTRYVRDYLNNDRTYDTWFLSDYLKQPIYTDIFTLRDHATNGVPYGYNRMNYDGNYINYAKGGTGRYINIGFCL